MATEDKVILELLKSHSDLTSDNPTLELGQRVFVTGITDALGNGEKIGDGVTAYTSLKWQRYELLETIDLTSSDVTYTLPKIDGGYQRVSIYAKNGGTYKMTLAVSNSETVDGIAAGTWKIEGKGRIIVESDGTNWQVREYEDSGGNANGFWKKYIDGELKNWTKTGIVVTTSTTGTGFFYNSTATLTFAKQFYSFTSATPTARTNTGVLSAGSYFSESTTSVRFWISGSTSSATGLVTYTAIGRWRT